MNGIALAKQIGIRPETVSLIEKFSMDAEREKQLKTLFYEDYQAFREEAAKEENANLAVLYLYLKWAEDTREKYREIGADESMFLDAMRDIQIWTEDHYVKTGGHGILDWGWPQQLMKLKVFRIGRLEFEPAVMWEDIEVNGKKVLKGENILGVHIPAGEKLSPEAVKESLLRAPAFFRKHYGTEYRAYQCGSWLLSPDLEKLLKPDSAILRFQKNFTLYAVKPSRQAEERVFLRVSDDYESYPEDTTLRKNLKMYLLSGGSVRNGSGIGFFEDIG